MASKSADGANEELKIKYNEDESVEVNGVWYSSLQSYFEKREEELKKKADPK